MTFAEELAKIPFAARQTDATGFVAPIMRASGHALFTVIGTMVGPEVVSDDEVIAELAETKSHWDAVQHDNEVFSAAIKDKVTVIGALIDAAITEYPTWTADNRKDNLRELANRFVLLGCDLDRELAGVTTSDPGFQL